ncbi:hypothetical protein HBI13_162210 [Parastagonospora nodorum]|nr:hypothetical protein HBI13_162210 [Parastagonospora nodorum]KAH4121115.1 hypothetical protein HBH47_106710 [Parastagonospora nodorum]KAH4836009.1 hypothetical protein HBH60_016840 [Parastagonospora nodorum]KAH4944548.1 hypothetical protein HBH73_148260 [Parastagonospora nodorum]KAH5085414.1 hypothetical protein HBH95_023100 [Parastagonospora nodorum]
MPTARCYTQRQLPKERQLDGWSCAGAPPLSHTAPVKELRTAAYGRAGKYSEVSAPVLFVYGRWNIVCENLTMNAERTQQTSTGIAYAILQGETSKEAHLLPNCVPVKVLLTRVCSGVLHTRLLCSIIWAQLRHPKVNLVCLHFQLERTKELFGSPSLALDRRKSDLYPLRHATTDELTRARTKCRGDRAWRHLKGCG